MIGKIHLWLGLASGLVIFILGFTGCILAFEEELKDFIYKDRYFVEQQHIPRLPIQKLLSIAQKTLGKNQIISGINIYQKDSRTISMSTYKGRPNGWNYFNVIDYSSTIYLNPYTGKVLYIENSKLEFFRLILMLHYNLLLEDVGGLIIGWSTFIFVILLISGLILWWPKSKAAAKQRFSFKWKATTKWKRKNYDLHNILGFYTLIFALLIALTGMVWAFSWFDNSVQWIANGGTSTPPEKPYTSDSTAHKNPAVFDLVYKDIQLRSPNDVYYISIPENRTATIYANSQSDEKPYQWTTFNYDQNTGKNLSVLFYKDKFPGEKLRNMNYYIHTGSILGFPGKILAFLVSLICTGLPITGFYIWWGRNQKNNKKKS